MVEAVRQGQSLRSVAQKFRCSPSTVQLWVQRAQGLELDKVDWTSTPSGSRTPSNRVSREMEELVIDARRYLLHEDILGEHGAPAIHRYLSEQHLTRVPSVGTIGRILQRNGLLDGRRRVRRPAPPIGWYLPDVREGFAEIDSWDAVEDLKIKDGPLVHILNVVSVLGGLVGSWPYAGSMTTDRVLECLEVHWREQGLPTYAQFDNGTIFQGPHQHADAIGRVTRFCLTLGVTPVFAPPREHGFQNAIESYNGRYQAKVWSRFQHESLETLQEKTQRYVMEHRRRSQARRDATPKRRSFPEDHRFDPKACPMGTIMFLRRTDDKGYITLLGHHWYVERQWTHRLVRVEVDLAAEQVRCFRLRRREPDDQPLLQEFAYRWPRKNEVE